MNNFSSYRSAASILLCVFSVFIYFLWGSNAFIQVLNEPYDSLRYIDMARNLAAGQWLGSYDHMTLIRPPIYAFALAINQMAGTPLVIFQQIIYLLSMLLLAAALKSHEISLPRRSFIFILGLLHPVAFTRRYLSLQKRCTHPQPLWFWPDGSAFWERSIINR